VLKDTDVKRIINMKKRIFNLVGHTTKSMLTLLTLVAFIAAVSCSKDDVTEIKLVPSDGTQVWYFNGYTIGASGPEWTPTVVMEGKFSPVADVEIKLENGNTFKSDASGKITINLPAGEYLFRLDIPNPWRTGYDSNYDWENDRYEYTLYDKIVYNNQWDVLHIQGAYTQVRELPLFKN